jgi:hypothetical protein
MCRKVPSEQKGVLKQMRELLRFLGTKTEKVEGFEVSCHKYVTYLVILLPVLTFLLVACGGGGSGSSSTDH